MSTVSRLASTPAHRSQFPKLWLANAISNIGDGVAVAAAPLLAASLTRDPALIAGVVFAQQLPWFVFSLISGALVDRLDRRRVMGLANLSRAALFVGLTLAIFTGWINLWLVYVIFFLLGVTETLVDNAAITILPAIVPRDRLEQANGRLYATQTLTNQFVGPPLGAWLFSLIVSIPFLANGVAYGLAALLALLLRGQFRSEQAASDVQQTLWRDIQEGVVWFLKHHLLRTLGVMAGFINFFSTATMAIFVLIAQDLLGLSDVQYGFLLATGAVGGIAGGLVADRLVKLLGGGWTIFVTNLLPGLAYLLVAIQPNTYIVASMFILTSFAGMIGNVVLISLRQAIIPDRLLGRVTSAYRLFALGAVPTGALFGGAIARTFGLTMPYLIGGIVLTMMSFALLPMINNRTVAAAREQTL